MQKLHVNWAGNTETPEALDSKMYSKGVEREWGNKKELTKNRVESQSPFSIDTPS